MFVLLQTVTYIYSMEVLKIDKSRLFSIPEYAKEKGVERQTVYRWLADPEKSRTIKVIEISGKKFIEI